MCPDHTHGALCTRPLPLCWPRLYPLCALRLEVPPYDAPTP